VTDRYPPIGDYGLIGDCHSVGLVSRSGSIDWCCMPRLDSGSVFGRILDWDRGGHCELRPTAADFGVSRQYLEGSLVLATTFQTEDGEARLLDCFAMRRGGATDPLQQLIRIVEGVSGRCELRLVVRPRFDYGDVLPWVRRHGPDLFSAVGGDDALLIQAGGGLDVEGEHDLLAQLAVRAGERWRLAITALRPEHLDREPPGPVSADELDRRLDITLRWWERWSSRLKFDGADAPPIHRSAVVLKALTNAPTGAVAAAATTSLPEELGGCRNWDYRFSWIRDSQFTVRALAALGCHAEADGFRRFIERSSAGNAESLQIAYGVGGERRLDERELSELEGYCGSAPVRVGNAASTQQQLDVYGELVELSWQWHRQGSSPDDDYWRFILSLVDTAADRWCDPDHGLWEIRGRPRHFVHSKVMCWVALDRGLRLAEECLRRAPVRRWRKVRNEIRAAIEDQGYNERTGTFVSTFGAAAVDASLLRLPVVDFVAYDDERMLRTADAIGRTLDDDGLVRRYRGRDGLPGREGAFVACSFWLAECLARQGRDDEARRRFDRALATSNDLGLFSEEYDPARRLQLGNFPQALTHLSHIAAALALREREAG